MKKTEVISRQEAKRKLPDGWQWVRLGDVARLERGKFTPRPRNDPRYYSGPYPWIQTGEVEAARKYITTYRNTLNECGLAVSKMFLKGTLVITIAATIGAVGILTFDSCMPDSLVGITPREGVSDTDFLYYLLLFVRNHLKSIAPQVAQANLKLSLLEPLEIPLPPLAEQKRIAVILNEQMAAVERSRIATEAQMDAAQALPAAYLRAVFNSPEAQQWPKKRLRDVCDGDGQYGTSTQANDTGVGLPVLRMGNLFEGQIRWDDLKFIQLPQTEEPKYRLEKGDILFNRTNSAELVGKTAVFDGSHEAVFASYLIRFRVVKEFVNPHYVAAYINSANGRRFIEANMARAIGQVNISASTMHKMPIPLPPPDEQERIAATLFEQMTTVERLRQALEEQLDAINQLPTTLLRRAFNGEL